ncbi:unnamed protein product [Nezara viridula]|uniref:Uncharacterized protein n=1 Tax=Nezara viridula TaxID=85310 RepID=A0A9P0GYK9_NEZVI|nr:unnamed protein product [Nezara viridula]
MEAFQQLGGPPPLYLPPPHHHYAAPLLPLPQPDLKEVLVLQEDQEVKRSQFQKNRKTKDTTRGENVTIKRLKSLEMQED